MACMRIGERAKIEFSFFPYASLSMPDRNAFNRMYLKVMG